MTWKDTTYLSWSILPVLAPKSESETATDSPGTKSRSILSAEEMQVKGLWYFSTDCLIWTVGGTAGLIIKRQEPHYRYIIATHLSHFSFHKSKSGFKEFSLCRCTSNIFSWNKTLRIRCFLRPAESSEFSLCCHAVTQRRNKIFCITLL